MKNGRLINIVSVAIGAGGIIWGLYTHFFTLAELRASIAEEKANVISLQETNNANETKWKQGSVARATAISKEISGTKQGIHNFEDFIQSTKLFTGDEQALLTQIIANMERLEDDAKNFVNLLKE